MGSLQDQLLKAGLVSAERVAELKRAPQPNSPAAAPKPPARNRPGKAPEAGTKERQARFAVRGRARAGSLKKPAAAAADGDISLTEAWRRRQASEKDAAAARLQAKLADEQARHRRNLELEALVAGHIQNDAEAMAPWYFLYRGRIRHIHVNAEQREALSRGEMGILSLRGRYLLLPWDVIERCAAIAPDLIPVLEAATEAATEAAGETQPNAAGGGAVG